MRPNIDTITTCRKKAVQQQSALTMDVQPETRDIYFCGNDKIVTMTLKRKSPAKNCPRTSLASPLATQVRSGDTQTCAASWNTFNNVSLVFPWKVHENTCLPVPLQKSAFQALDLLDLGRKQSSWIVFKKSASLELLRRSGHTVRSEHRPSVDLRTRHPQRTWKVCLQTSPPEDTTRTEL